MRSTDLLAEEDLHRFARQLILSGFEEDHQLALLKSHIAVIGAGGLGAPLLQYLAAAGIGHITIFDDDVVELTNLNRQVIHQHKYISSPKTTSAADQLNQFDPELKLIQRQERFDENTTGLDDITLICDASDNAATRYMANRFAHQHHIPLVFGAAVRMEGQLGVFQSGVDNTAPCYECVFPSTAGPDLAPGCAEAGILGPITGVIGSLMALEAIRLCLTAQNMPQPLGPGVGMHLILFDGAYMTLDKILLKKNQGCACCGSPD